MQVETSTKKHIALFMLPQLTTGAGAEKYFIELARNLSRQSFDVTVVTLDSRSFHKFIRLMNIYYFLNFLKKIDVTPLFRETEETVKNSLGNATWKQVSFTSLKNELAKYDLIYTKNEISELLTLFYIGYSALPPIIVGVHTPVQYKYVSSIFTHLHNFVYAGFIYKKLLAKASAVHVSNQFTHDYLKRSLKTEVRLIHYPFSASGMQSTAREVVPAITFDKSKFNIVYIARLCEQKGSDILVRIIESIEQDVSIRESAVLNIFGSGEKYYEELFMQFSKKYTWVNYFGHVENKYVPYILSRQSLLISPSRWEVSPYNILEAQAMGVPVIASNIPGSADIVVSKKTGILVDKYADYIFYIKEMLRGKIKFESGEIINHIDAKFSYASIYEKLASFFREYVR